MRALPLYNLPWTMLLLLAMPIFAFGASSNALNDLQTRPQQQQPHGQHNPKLISIIMPVYERPALLNLALEQIGHTNYEGEIEVIVIDDSEMAMDATRLSSYLSPTKHTLMYHHLNDRRYTVGAKRNIACNEANGDIIVMMDDDDIYHPDRIDYQVKPILNGNADMSVLRQDIWLQFYGDGHPSQFYKAVPKMAQSVHYGTLAFRKDVWNPDMGIVYTDASLLDEVDFYNKVKDMPSMRIIELSNNGMHVYVRHPQNINRPGTDLAKDQRFVPTGQPHTLPKDQVMRLEAIVARMHGVKTRNLQEPLPTCGPCVEVDGACVTTDECHDVYGGRSWSMCIDPPLVSSCTSCERSSDEICEERCVDSNGCQTLLDCYDMYADYPDIDCGRFPSCDCNGVVPWNPPADEVAVPEWTHQCGACVDVNGPCVSADECWDMYKDDSSVWSKCVESSGIIPCSDCERSSDEICGDRCVMIGAGPCSTMADCFDMYANYPVVDCNRFASCDCDYAVPRENDQSGNIFEDDTPPTLAKRCGACVDVGPCVTADECYDMYKDDPGLRWEMCMDSSTITLCSDCEKSPNEMCENRCVDNYECESLEQCYDMYADGSAPEVDCDRFPSCECGPSSDTVTVPPAPAEEDFPYTKPEFRYEAFSELGPAAQGIARQELSYMEVTWNNHGLAPIEKQRWSTLSSNEREGAQQLGYDEDQWDCFINHYEQYTWDELGEKGVQKHYEALGWTQGHWEGTTGEVAYAETKWWGQLTDNEKKAANALCYFQQNWDEVDLTPNPSYFPHPMPDFRYVPWGELDAVTKNTAAGLLDYTEELWDNLGTSAAEKTTFRNLDAIEQKGALELGFYIHTWDCFMNHYLSLFWSTLPDDLKVAIETLGWTEAMWSDESDELPSSKSKPWIDLTPDEKAAATRLCYFQETWDEEPITKWYDYEAGESEAKVAQGPLPKDVNLDIFEDTGYVGKKPGSVGVAEYISTEPASSSYRTLVSSKALVLVLSIGAFLLA